MKNDLDFLNQLHHALERNFRTKSFGVTMLASQMNVSERHLQRRVGALTGQSPIKYVRCFRLQKSLGLLRNGAPVGKTALAVGFSSHAYFACCFKARFGTTPSQFQTRTIPFPNLCQRTEN
jgi:AraC-like DNA-binding protein